MKKISFILILFVLFAACNNTATSDQSTETTTTEEVVYEFAEIPITGMHCDGCVNTITNALKEIDGVSDAKTSLEKEIAKVKYDPAKVDIEQFKTAIEGKGYGVGAIEIIDTKNPSAKPEEKTE